MTIKKCSVRNNIAKKHKLMVFLFLMASIYRLHDLRN